MVSMIEKVVIGIVSLIILIIVSFQLVGNTSGDLIDSADNISASGLPLANLFSSNGVLLIIFMVGLFIALMLAIFKGMKVGK